ncbi:MAG: heme lyase CcmF/NrfE family subunit [Acidobacteria bacterium]|nr:heme lyase CcmF/NrfE family subunit [Acidobacteriota bacterium]
MRELGQICLVLSLATAGYAVAASLLGARRLSAGLIQSGRNAVYATTALVLTAGASLIYLLVTDRFDALYVVQNSRAAMPVQYKVSALWGGMEGSLLLWAMILGIYSGVVAYQNRRRHPALMPYVHAVCMVTTGFFVSLMLFSANPFLPLGFTAADGQGMNPLLQNPAMAIHPPNLYLGFVGFTIPFAFAVAALVTGRLDTTWLHSTRRWTIIAWLFLSIGIILGAQWAYVELGWGGFWGWDPVENASLMPWLLATAYLHSVMIEEKKQMLRVWNVLLIIATFAMCIFGTFLTRSGIVSSVHAFANSNLGPMFAIFLALVLAGSLGLVAYRLPELKSEGKLDAVLSRESSFLFNNLVLVVACFAVLWGTMFPVITEAITGTQMTVGPPFFNRVNVPIMLLLLLLTGVGPLIAWRKASLPSLKRAFATPTATGVVTLGTMFYLGVRDFATVMAFALAAFVTATILQEFWRGARARGSATGEAFHRALVSLTWRNKRRYGGYIIHIGIVCMAIGITGSSSFQRETQATLLPGQTVDFAGYRLQMGDLELYDSSGVQVVSAELLVFQDGEPKFRMWPQRHFHPGPEVQPTTEVAIWSNMRHDLYVVLAAWDLDRGSATFKAYLNPLVKWIWIGGLVLVFGTVICMLPDRSAEVGARNY